MTVSERHLEAHLVAAIAVLAEHGPATRAVARGDGVAVSAVGAGGPSFNTGWVLDPPSDAGAAVVWVCDTLAATGRPYAVYVTERSAAHVSQAMATHGLALRTTWPLMVRAAADEPPALPPGLRVEHVADLAALEKHAIAVAAGFGAPDPRMALTVFVPTLLDDDRVAMFNGYVDGGATPAATSVCIVAEGIAGIYAVTTHEPARRRGVGAALTLAAVAAGARSGAPVAALQATAMGESVYRRLGFATVTSHERWEQA